MLDQERAGIDVLSTGEMMRVRFIVGFYERLTGIRPLPAPRQLGPPLWDTHTPFEVIEKIAAPRGLGIVEEFTLARSLTSRPLKATVPGPYTLLVPLRLRGGYRTRTRSSPTSSASSTRSAAPSWPRAPSSSRSTSRTTGCTRGPSRRGRGVNGAVDGVEAKIAVHVCFGNLYGRPFSAVRDYRNVFPTLGDLRASQIVLEFANRGMEDLARWKDFPRDKELGAGVIDVKAFKAETAPTWPRGSARS